MSLRVKLLLLFTLAVAAAAGFTAWTAEHYAQRQFRQADQQRSDALVAQFRRELSERETEVTTSVQTIADAESTVRMVLDLSRPGSDPSVYAGDARGLANAHQLDFLELAGADGTLISSAQWPDHVGYKNDWVTRQTDWNQRGAFLDRIELPDRVELALLTVRVVHGGNVNLYIIGGERLNNTFLETLSLPAGMRALLYRNLEAEFVPAALTDAEGSVSGAETFEPLIESLQRQPHASGGTIEWTPGSSSAERFVALPLTGRKGEFLGALLLGSAQDQRIALENYIGGSALAVAAAGLLFAFFLSWWISARVSRPLARLSEGIGEVTSGDWDAQVDPGAVREVSQTIAAFNKMTHQLIDERAGQVARERAAAWRQLAGQLAAELKTLLPPLQQALESLARQPDHALDAEDGFADDGAPALDLADDANDSASADRLQPVSSAMRQTLETLAACAGKLGEFAALPVPHLNAVNLNDVVRAAVQSFEPRFSAIGRPPITPELFLDERLGLVRADAVLLRKAIDNLLIFVLEDMPTGGTFTIHTRRQDDMAHMILSGSGSGPIRQRGEARNSASESAARVSGIGLSLATVQSIVSSHGGRISIESAPLAGTTFYLDWPIHSASAQCNVSALPAVLQDHQGPESGSRLDPESGSRLDKERPATKPAEPPPPEPQVSPEMKQEAQGGPATVEFRNVSDEALQENDRIETPIESSLDLAPAPATEPLSALSVESPSALQAEREANVAVPLAAASPPESSAAQPAALQWAKADQAQSDVTETCSQVPEIQSPALQAQTDAQAETQSGAAPKPQSVAVAAAVAVADAIVDAEAPAEMDEETDSRDLAAVIEEVIETRTRSHRAVDSFLSERQYQDETEELEVSSVPISSTSPLEAPAPNSPSPELFAILVPSPGRQIGLATAPAALAQAEPRPEKRVAPEAPHLDALAPLAQNGRNSAPQAPPSAQNEDHSNHEASDHRESASHLSYSPLTYRW